MENLIKAKVVGLTSENLHPNDVAKGIKQVVIVETQETLKADTGELSSTVFKRLKSEVIIPKTAVGTVQLFSVKIVNFEGELYYRILSVAKA